LNGLSIADRLAAARDAVAEACRKAGRPADAVRLLAVSKRHPAAAVLEAARAGQCEFAENYVQEGRDKIAAVAAEAPGLPLLWHFIGHLQSNKAAAAAGSFEVIQGLDAVRAGRRLASVGRERGRPVRVFLQICLGEGGARAGILPAEAPALLEEIADPEGLAIEGVMGVAPAEGEPGPHFARLRECRDSLQALGLPGAALVEMSAGMSGDFEEAIREGATMVRLGTSVFGPRPD
jgi:pyridoxal phosphate enzyme (YggS family)